MSLWLNGRQAASRESQVHSYEARDRFVMGTKGRPDLPKFKGILDDVRLYNRALSEDEIVAHLLAEAAGYGLPVVAAKSAAAEDAGRFFESHPNAIDVAERGEGILLANRRIGLLLRRRKPRTDHPAR